MRSLLELSYSFHRFELRSHTKISCVYEFLIYLRLYVLGVLRKANDDVYSGILSNISNPSWCFSSDF